MLTSFNSFLSRSIPSPLCINAVEITQIRRRKRGRKSISKQQKLKLTQIKEERQAQKKTFSERVQLSRMAAAKIAIHWPPRYDAEAEKNLQDTPSRNSIYFVDSVKTHFYTISEALEMHRKLHKPEIYGNKDALLKFRMELNMNTEKTSKFIGDSRQLVSIPFPFPSKEKRTILAFAPDREMQEEALAAGADLALGPDSIKKVLKGKFLIDDYDFCVAHQDMMQTILPLRGVLRARFPTKINGGIGSDLKEVLAKFLSGINIIVKPNLAIPEWGLCEPIVGRLNMPDDEISANIETVMSIVCKLKNPAIGPFINRALLMTIPGDAFYSVDISAWERIATEEDMNKLEKRKKQKKKEKKVGKSEEKSEDERIMEKWTQDPLFNLM